MKAAGTAGDGVASVVAAQAAVTRAVFDPQNDEEFAPVPREARRVIWPKGSERVIDLSEGLVSYDLRTPKSTILASSTDPSRAFSNLAISPEGDVVLSQVSERSAVLYFADGSPSRTVRLTEPVVWDAGGSSGGTRVVVSSRDGRHHLVQDLTTGELEKLPDWPTLPVPPNSVLISNPSPPTLTREFGWQPGGNLIAFATRAGPFSTAGPFM